MQDPQNQDLAQNNTKSVGHQHPIYKLMAFNCGINSLMFWVLVVFPSVEARLDTEKNLT